MMGTASRRTTHRIRATGRTLFVLGAALILVAVLAPFVSAQGNSPTAECGEDGFLVKFDWNGEGWDIEPEGGDVAHAITISDVTFNDEDEPVSFDWSQGETTATVGSVVVFGGGSAATYGPGDANDLTAPDNDRSKKEGDTYAISHITFCAGEPNVVEIPSETPSETPTDITSETPSEGTNVVETPTESEEPSEEPTITTTEPTDGPTEVLGVVIERPPAPGPAPEPDAVAEPEVLGNELPTTGPEDLWLAGLALMLMGSGLLVLARGRSMGAAAHATGTWWMSRTP